MSIAASISERVLSAESGSVWTYSDFKSLPTRAVAASLSRLAKTGILRRARKGVYYKPRSTRWGMIAPDSNSIAEAVFRHRGIRWVPTGLPVYNALGLTTQVSSVSTYAVEDGSISLKTGLPGRVRLRRAIVGDLSAEERGTLDALRDLKKIPDTTPAEVLNTLSAVISSERVSFRRLVTAAMGEPPRVRALLGAIGSEIHANPTLLARLKKSLNPTTSFKVGLSSTFPASHTWNIL
jgi:hypothetical protein